jgi:2-hydroxy-3-keto-5-methylthiopentenyl-1-phosphate phosphatase
MRLDDTLNYQQHHGDMSDGKPVGKEYSRNRILVSDFDGTMTRQGFIEVVQARFPVQGHSPWDDYMSGRITHFQAVALILSRIRADENTLETMFAEMELDPALPGVVRRLEMGGWKVIVASAGCRWYIQRLLAGAGLSITVYANPGTYHPEQGLIMTMPDPSPYTIQETGIDKLAVVKQALATGAEVAYAGDGRPDIDSILAVLPDRRFARHWLAQHLRKAGHKFHSFNNWNDIALGLLNEEAMPTHPENHNEN